jgi:hypothetical protein
MANGKGRLIHADGDVYEGDWRDDRAHGQGKRGLSSREVHPPGQRLLPGRLVRGQAAGLRRRVLARRRPLRGLLQGRQETRERQVLLERRQLLRRRLRKQQHPRQGRLHLVRRPQVRRLLEVQQDGRRRYHRSHPQECSPGPTEGSTMASTPTTRRAATGPSPGTTGASTRDSG